MSNLPARSLLHPVIFIVIIILALASWHHSTSYRDTNADTMAQESNTQHAGALSRLTVRIRQSQTSPPAVTLSVTNDYDSPLTILRWNTPLDPVALQVGVLTITPEGKDAPLDLPIVQLRRIMPPPEDDIITLQPGETREQEVVLRESIVPPEELGEKAHVAVKGDWQAVWPTSADKLSQETIEKLQFGDGVLTGAFETEVVDVITA